MSKHTPGPWGCLILSNGAIAVAPQSDKTKRIATVHLHMEGAEGSIGSSPCNARLIAAAPDLLEFAKWYVNFVEDHDDDAKEGMPRYQAAKALVAKAEGDN